MNAAQPAAETSGISELPPLRTDPTKYLPTSSGDVRKEWSGCVICPTFSSSVIRPSRSSTRSAIGRVASR